MASAEYTYLTVPPGEALSSCIGLVVAGLAARAKIGVAGLEEAIELLESQQSAEAPTRYRFCFTDGGLVAEVEEDQAEVQRNHGASAWRTVVEMVA